MSFSPEVQELIEQVEELSGRPVHVSEEQGMTMRATVMPARGGAPAHLVRFRPGSTSLDYLVGSQLLFLVRTFSCPEKERWEIAGTLEEQNVGIETMGLGDFPEDLGRSLVGQIITQVRSYAIGFRVDETIRKQFPGIKEQQEKEVRSQLAENERALSPEIRSKFPKPLVDTNSAMNACHASFWAKRLGEPRFVVPFAAMGYRGKAEELQAILDEVPDEPSSDQILVERWGDCLGLTGAYHFNHYSLG